MSNVTIYNRAGLLPEAVRSKLRPNELRMINAANGKRISEYEERNYYEFAGRLAERICHLVGLKKAEVGEVKIFADFLRNYYSGLTLREVLTAFELCLVGELDAYLPRDRYGAPDKNHYQAFSVSYVSRILNAYRNYKGSVEVKAIEAQPKALPEVPKTQQDEAVKKMLENIKRIFLLYKYTGRMELTQMNELTIYRELERLGLAVTVVVTDEDRKSAVIRLNGKARSGVFNDFVSGCIRGLGQRHPYVPDEAAFIARGRAVRDSFDEIIKEEIQLTDLL